MGSLAKRTKRERGKKGIWNWVSGEGKGFEPQRRYDAKGTQRKIYENLFNPLAYFFKHKAYKAINTRSTQSPLLSVLKTFLYFVFNILF